MPDLYYAVELIESSTCSLSHLSTIVIEVESHCDQSVELISMNQCDMMYMFL